MRTYGTLKLEDGRWLLECEPHVAIMAKRVFGRLRRQTRGVLELSNTDAVCRDLEWFTQRYPLDVKDADALAAGSRRHRDDILTFDRILGAKHKPRKFDLALPLRKYQAVATELYLARRYLLLADQVGLGKTAVVIGSYLDPRTLPAAVVTLAHLPRQWEREINKFAPALHTHVVRKATPYELPTFMGEPVDVVILNYHKLAGWASELAKLCRSVAFDEVQELRHSGSQKYGAAETIVAGCDLSIGLSATPIYNYGGEIFNVINALRTGVLGTAEEFAIEWCEGQSTKQRLADPIAFGQYLRDERIMLRRTRAEVGRELPPVQRITHEIDCDQKQLDQVEGSAKALAEIILSKERLAGIEKMRAAEQFSTLLRQATGLAKAPYVAQFVRLLIENGEPVVLYGWHRAVYSVWLDMLRDLRPAMYTGSESGSQKDTNAQRFIRGETNLIVISLRAGAGLNGLEKRCRIVVFGELDYSPGVHEQNIGRVNRDGQADPVTAYFLLAMMGSDPFMAELLGLKREQIEGIRGGDEGGLERLERGADDIRQLAQDYLRRCGPKRRRRKQPAGAAVGA